MITPRLQAILNLTDAKILADIGTDHAYIPIRLIKEKKIKKAIACDKNEGPIKAAKENVIKYGFSDCIDLRTGDGLSPIEKGEADTIIIAGMGGKLISDIIGRDIDKARSSTLILQPMNAQYELRKFLIKNGFTIVKEELASEGFKVYNLMVVENGKDNKIRTELDLHIPKELVGHKFYYLLKEKKKREFLKISRGRKKSAEDSDETVKYYEDLLNELKTRK